MFGHSRLLVEHDSERTFDVKAGLEGESAKVKVHMGPRMLLAHDPWRDGSGELFRAVLGGRQDFGHNQEAILNAVLRSVLRVGLDGL